MAAKLTDPLPRPHRRRGRSATSSFVVVRDSREKVGQGWIFEFEGVGGCGGTVVKGLPTGDYSVVGYETEICIERKACVAEFAKNICQKRFWRELERMRSFPFAYLILEFTMADVMKWPVGSGIPKYKWQFLRVTKNFIAASIRKIEIQYPNIKVILAGGEGHATARHVLEEAYRGANAQGKS